MAYGIADEALSLFAWLKIGSGQLSQLGQLGPWISNTAMSLHVNFVYNADTTATNNNHTLKRDW